ncbi:hypothetical protein H0N99_03635 [Candidatus Micrarchaeota archaeon]|nr:hypothetical protein [Candidatus Micrarchaeota archaeon]
MKKLLLMLLLLSGMVFAERAGLVVQFNSSSVTMKCVEFQSGASAFDILMNSGLQLVTKDYGAGLGMALCKIGDTGCGEDNCFCASEYWGFYYIAGSSWEYAPVGVSGFTVSNGDVLGFRWGAYGDRPELHSFSEICPPSAHGGGESIRYFNVSMNGNCSKEQFMINVKERERGVIWEPSGFFVSGLGYMKVENGVGIRVLLHETHSGNDAGFEKVAFLFTDKEGNASFIPEKPGKYELEFDKEGFLGERREIDINECRRETATSNPVEELKPKEKEVEPNITRVDIIAPQSANVNSTVTVKMLSEDGKPLSYGSITVEFSGGRKELVTNESGEATFTAEKEGVYSYSSPNHTLSAYRTTNVMELNKIVLKSPVATQVVQEETPASIGMAAAGASPEIIGAGVVLVLVLLYFIQRVIE